MAEVAGTIVGVISLSLQLYDKLSEYTNGVKDAKKKAEQITRELDTLVELLEYLETATSRMDPTTPVALVKAIIQQCALSIESIRAKVGDNASMTHTSSFSTQSRQVMKRLAYPFKETDIKYWRDALSSIRQNLQIALQALEIDKRQQNFATVQGQLVQLSLNTQMILDQQQRAQNAPTRSILNQSRGLGIATLTNGRYSEFIQASIDQPDQMFAQDMSSPRLQSLPVTRVQHNTLLPISAVSLEEETMDFRDLEQRIPPMRGRRIKTPSPSTPCICRKRLLRKQFVQSPFAVSRDETHYHDPSCPFWIPGSREVTVGFGIMLCYMILGMKMRLFMQLSIGNGTFSIMPSLSIRRIVTVLSSPAFRLIDFIFLWNHDPCTVKDYSMELKKIFQTRQASPHDRLEGGQTLLHFLCMCINMTSRGMDPSGSVIYRSLLKQLLSYMDFAAASDTDDNGMTCIDYLLSDSGFVLPSHDVWKIFGSDLLCYDLKISSTINHVENYGSWLELPFNTFSDPFSGLSKPVVAALLRSEVEFNEMVKGRHPYDALSKEEAVRLFDLTTRMGWVRGCEILLDSGSTYVIDPERRMPLLLLAVESRNPAMVQFWLGVRQNAGEQYLKDIGGLEVAIIHASVRSNEDLAAILATHLVEQRRQLHQMIKSSDIDHECLNRSRGILDVHCACAIRVLEKQNVKIPPSFRSIVGSIYCINLIYDDTHPRLDVSPMKISLKVLQFLYDTGFRDIATKDFECSQNISCPPLHFAVAKYPAYYSTSHSLSGLFQIVDWFLRKGARITDCWLGLNSTASHFIGAKAAMIFFYSSSDEAIPDGTFGRLINIFQQKLTDDCECRCSTQGCTSITSFHNQGPLFTAASGGLEGISILLILDHTCPEDQDQYRKIRKSVHCVAQAAKNTAHRWIITDFIRVCLFSWLDIRHTCCELKYMMGPCDHSDFSRPPPLRYPPDELHRIQEEDAYLICLLEDLVKSFDARYDAHEGDLLSFVNNVMVPEVNILLDRLKQEDENAYAAGRREMGVVMVDECENDLIREESESLDEAESDAVGE